MSAIVAALIVCELLPMSLLTPIANDLRIIRGVAGQAVRDSLKRDGRRSPVRADLSALRSPISFSGIRRTPRLVLVTCFLRVEVKGRAAAERHYSGLHEFINRPRYTAVGHAVGRRLDRSIEARMSGFH